ncbi:MAG: GGDEF domain-containing protein [Gammaproteobacteria bacterium]|nr:GGDEF domain-containing protein [Gammaproteobacteria bacterium]
MSDNISPDTAPDKSRRKALSIKALLARIAVIVMLMELFIMAAFDVFPEEVSVAFEALLDAALLVLISIPLIYFWVIRPFVRARDEAEERIAYLAFHDSLTRLANRRLLIEYLEKYLAVCERHPIFGALIFVDLDGFKKVNDTYGHNVGDALLIEVAKRLKIATRSEDTLSRLGGDEFVLLVQQLDISENVARSKAITIAEKMHRSLCEPIYYDEKKLAIGASIGIYIIGTKKMSAKTAIGEADKAMYSAKQRGGGQITVFDEALGP